MRHALAIRILFIFIAISCAIAAHACQCGIAAHGRNAWENAQELSKSATVIFEGEPVKFELRWSLLTAKAGDLIPTEAFFHSFVDNDPHMVITFRVARTYKGDLGAEVQLHTGLGGGDCAANYETGLKYLVYAGGSDLDHLGVSMCSPGAWIESPEIATDLRYLRKERPTPMDLTRILHWSEAGWDKQEEQRKHNYEESRKRFQSATGRICGTLLGPDPRDSDSRGAIVFLSAIGYSPLSPFDTFINKGGSFCSPDLGPGKYYLYFIHAGEHGNVASYYPGVTDVAKATRIEVYAGQTQSNVTFKVPDQDSYSVRGFLFADERSDFSKNVGSSDVTVALIRTDGDLRLWFSETATFFLPKTAYFKFRHVPPGHYVAYVSVPAQGWMTRKVEVDVTTHMKFISLDIVHSKSQTAAHH